MSTFRLFDLNPAQYEAATHEGGPLLILAGAGTGKTRVITARIAWLISRGIKPESIVAVTFTNKAAREMRDRVATMVSLEDARLITTSTFHALCLRILRGDAERLGYKSNFSIYDESDQLGLIRKIISRVAAKDEKLDPHVAKALISKAKSMGWRAPAGEESLIGAVYARYQTELKALNAVDFDDLLLLTIRLLGDHADVRDKWRDRYEHVLVDEFQDTNQLQLDLISLLARKDSPNVVVVGDDDQSIYGWRGAELSNILEFERHFPNPHVVKLEQNYRSTNTILEAANRLIRNNAQRRGKQLWSPVTDGKDVHIVSVPDDRQEAEFVATEIAAHRDETGAAWEHFAVLFRMNAQSRLIEENLRRLRIPYRVIGGKSFFDRREIKDVLAYLACINNRRDDQALLRIIGSPPRGIGATTMELALEESIQASRGLFETLQSPAFLERCSKKVASAIETFATELETLRIQMATPDCRLADTASAYLEACGYFESLKRDCRSEEEALSRESNVRELFNALTESQNRSNAGLQGFLDEINLNREREEDREDVSNAVTLITLHAAKGLEFPHVYLIGAEDGVLPHSRSKEEDRIEEERRLLYVGITRAMRTLVITHCQQRTRYGESMLCKRSPFLEELEGEGVRFVSHDEIAAEEASEEAAMGHFSRLKDMIG